MAPLRDTLSGLSNRSHGFISNFGVKITDTFARTTSGSLGNATTGNVWTQTNGTWYSNSGVAVTATAASSYPFATTPYNQNMTATVKTAPSGSGLVFWQSGANDWWAAASSGSTSQYISSYTCNSNACCTGANNCTYNGCCTGANNCSSSATCGASNNCSANSCCSGANNCVYVSNCGTSNNCIPCNPGWSGCGTCSRYITANKQTVYYYAGYNYYAGAPNSCCSGSNNCVSNSCCTGSNYAGTYNACCTGANNCSANSCCTGSNNCASNACCTQTANYSTQWNWVLNIIKNVSSTITTVTSSAAVVAYSNTPSINAVSVTTSGNNVTATGYSDTAATTSNATVSSTNTGTKGSGVGIILVPGGTSQASQVGPFTAQ